MTSFWLMAMLDSGSISANLQVQRRLGRRPGYEAQWSGGSSNIKTARFDLIKTVTRHISSRGRFV